MAEPTVASPPGVRAVRTTGIYCREGCPARPAERNVTTYAVAAAAEAAGYRACHRCRPYRDDSFPTEIGPELVCRAVRLVVQGALDSGGEAELAARVGVSPRHLRRLFEQHVGVSPDGLARSRRAHFARRLLDDTDLTVRDVAFASGFGSVRQLQRACVETFGTPPRELRMKRRSNERLVADGGLVLRLEHRGPLDWPALLQGLAARAVPGVEAVEAGSYRRTVVLDGAPGVIELSSGRTGTVELRAHLPYWDGLIHVVRAVRRLTGLDRDPGDASAVLSADPLLAPLLEARPGLRPPGCWDPFELCVRAVLGQQVSVAVARGFAARLVSRHGAEVPGLAPMGLCRTFPDPATLADADLDGIGLTGARVGTLRTLAASVASGELDLDAPSTEPEGLRRSLLAIRGIGEWTADYVALRMGEPDAFCAGDAALRSSVARLTGEHRPTAAELESRAERWRPWRALAATHLWAAAA